MITEDDRSASPTLLYRITKLNNHLRSCFQIEILPIDPLGRWFAECSQRRNDLVHPDLYITWNGCGSTGEPRLPHCTISIYSGSTPYFPYGRHRSYEKRGTWITRYRTGGILFCLFRVSDCSLPFVLIFLYCCNVFVIYTLKWMRNWSFTTTLNQKQLHNFTC